MASGISVCMAVRNGESYLREQLSSILPQLAGEDELIISDDHSTDNTVRLIREYQDARIRLLINPGQGVITNFENTLRAARGTYIFLADQDDVWMQDKVEKTMRFLMDCDLVVSDCVIVNESLLPSQESFYQMNGSGKGLVRNLLRNSYMGCCMAFHRKVLSRALPFPEKIPMHDIWIGLTAEVHFNVKFISDKLLFHRRHQQNATTTSESSTGTLAEKLTRRFWLLKSIIAQSYAA